ncbi:MAG: PQQ-binding-like beta-propeller repeat protein [Acidobacteria bacterium]|nr:PQQ-binding-like beta-propeller repeat protein [Acidobacteriota bacterium]
MSGFLLLLLAASLCTAADHNWPQFHGPAASGVGAGAPPSEWNGEKGTNILWKTPVPGLGHSSPVIWGDRMFLTTAIPAEGAAPLKVGLYGDITPVKNEGAQKLTVMALDRKTGKVVWQQTAFDGVPKFLRHPKSTHANPTPATDGKHLVAFFGSEGLFCYDLNGKLLWKKDLGPLDAGFFRVPSAQWGFASSPVLFEGKVLVLADVQKDSFVAAFDVKTGKEVWRTRREDVPTFGSPAVLPYTAGGKKSWQVVINGWKHTGGYALDSGKELWRLNGGGDIPVPTPIFSSDLVLLTSAHGSDRPIYAIRPDAAGDITGNKQHIAWKAERTGNYMQTPVALDGIGYFCFDNGVLSVFQLATGERLYQQRLGAGTSGYSSSAVAAGGKLYITNEDGLTHVLALGKEYKELSRNELGETVMASPAIAGDVLYIRGQRHLYAIGKK